MTIAPRVNDKNLKIAADYSKLLVDAETAKIRNTKDRIQLRNPYFEDREGYNLEACI